MSGQAESPALSAAVEELLAKQAITEQIYLYCRAMDRIDRELGKTIWHPDGMADYGTIFQGTGAEFIEWVCLGHSQMLGYSHQVANIVISVTGETATSEAYVCAALRQMREGQVVQATIRGRYLDRWSRRDGRWAIDRRMYVHDFDDVRDITEQRIEPFGHRDRRDPVYALGAG